MFIQLNRMMYPLMEEPSDKGGGLPDVMGKDDIIKFLGDEDDKPEVIDLEDKPVKEEKPKDKDEDIDDTDKDDDDDSDDTDDELKDIEDELKGPSEDKIELVTPVRRKEILKLYPDLFKKFPYLENAYYREQAFTELLPTIADAKKAVEKSQTLDNFENDLLGGNTEKILSAVKTESPESFNKLVDNYLPTLAKVDEKAYHHVLGTIIKHTIINMVSEGKNSNNDALQAAAQILNQFVFGKSEFTPPSKLSSDTKPDDKGDKLSERERNFTKQRFDSAVSDLNSRVSNSLKATIEANIDPKSTMTEYVKRNASRESIENLNQLISQDTRLKVIIDRLWEKAAQEDFSKESVDKIRSAFLSKARTLLPSVIKKARNEALKGMGKRIAKEDETREPRKERSNKDEPPSKNSSGKIKAGMSTLEYLMSDD